MLILTLTSENIKKNLGQSKSNFAYINLNINFYRKDIKKRYTLFQIGRVKKSSMPLLKGIHAGAVL